METHLIRTQANMRRLLDSRAREKAAEKALQDQPVPGTYQRYLPEMGSMLSVQFPGEVIRCTVKKIISPDAVLILVDSVPMAKSHTFEFDKMYGVRRRFQDGKDIWVAQKDDEFLAEQARLVGDESVRRVTKRQPPISEKIAAAQKAKAPEPARKKGAR